MDIGVYTTRDVLEHRKLSQELAVIYTVSQIPVIVLALSVAQTFNPTPLFSIGSWLWLMLFIMVLTPFYMELSHPGEVGKTWLHNHIQYVWAASQMPPLLLFLNLSVINTKYIIGFDFAIGLIIYLVSSVFFVDGSTDWKTPPIPLNRYDTNGH